MRIILTILFLLLPLSVFADELEIPFDCWPKQLLAEFAKTGRKVDLVPEHRTKESWGYILSKGSSYKIYTYYPATPDDFEVIKEVVFKVEIESKE